MRSGEVFVVPLADGRFGAVRIIRLSKGDGGRTTALVGLTPWIGTSLPTVAEPEMRKLVVHDKGHLSGRVAVCWYQGRPSVDFILIGIIEPSEEELAIDPRGAYCGSWSRGMVREALVQRGETAEGVMAVIADSAKTAERDKGIVGRMEEAEFWNLIAMLDWHASSADAVVEPLIDHLSHRKAECIAGFESQLAEKLYVLDRVEFARAIGEFAYREDGHFSPDHFLDVRAAVVAKGKQFYESVLMDASRMPKSEHFEPLLGVAQSAYERKFGDAPLFFGIKSYETFSNKDGWQES